MKYSKGDLLKCDIGCVIEVLRASGEYYGYRIVNGKGYFSKHYTRFETHNFEKIDNTLKH